MSKIISLMMAAAIGSLIVSTATVPAAAAKDSLYDRKNEECKRQASAKKFGIHFIQRNRWIKECIARS
jgi:uncharacterized membrane protein